MQISIPLEEARKKIWLVDSKVMKISYFLLWYFQFSFWKAGFHDIRRLKNILIFRVWLLILVWSHFNISRGRGRMNTNLSQLC